ncbi:MFS transporter [Anatilimnocola floriformis]|uniref:MFS transporter n=1 Tax=Anatilimnocola floriformis TaxID=2948575 RepID=UPI0020C26422|nr:MFS transporter [Anatilimnocola floriformis]
MNSIRFKLGVMMFLQFFIWGAWLPPSFGFFGAGALGFTDWQQNLLNFCFPIAAIIAMFGANQFVDRNFAAERYLAFSHLIGGLAILGFGVMSYMAFQGETAHVQSFWLYFLCMAVHCFFYVPTISVTNTMAFANLKDPQKDFGPVRLWGTIGWIAASWPFIFILADWAKIPSVEAAGGFVKWLGMALGTGKTGIDLNAGKSFAFITAGIASLLLAAFSLALPHTPPKRVETGKGSDPLKSNDSSLAWLEAMKLLRHPFLFVLFIVTFIDATVHDGFFFYGFTYLEKVGVPSNWIQPAMTVGQISEILTMAILGYVLKSLGWRYTMVIGVLGHALRFAVFAMIPNPYVAVAVNIVHGVCYAFFFATLYIFVDAVFPKDARTSAQGLFNFLILGMGPIASRYVWPALQSMYTVPVVDKAGNAIQTIQYNPLLLFPSGAAIVAALLLLFFFHPPKDIDESTVEVGH